MSIKNEAGIRIDNETKARTTEALRGVGVPNRTTREAMKELDGGEGRRFGSIEELFRDLGI